MVWVLVALTILLYSGLMVYILNKVNDPRANRIVNFIKGVKTKSQTQSNPKQAFEEMYSAR